MEPGFPKNVIWVASSLDDLREFPDSVKQSMGFALYQAQHGGKHPQSKPLKGFKGGGVLEAIEDFDGKAYRTVYTVRFANAVYVLHAFQKKARRGIATPKHDMEIVRSRLKTAERLDKSAPHEKEDN